MTGTFTWSSFLWSSLALVSLGGSAPFVLPFTPPRVSEVPPSPSKRVPFQDCLLRSCVLSKPLLPSPFSFIVSAYLGVDLYVCYPDSAIARTPPSYGQVIYFFMASHLPLYTQVHSQIQLANCVSFPGLPKQITTNLMPKMREIYSGYQIKVSRGPYSPRRL